MKVGCAFLAAPLPTSIRDSRLSVSLRKHPRTTSPTWRRTAATVMKESQIKVDDKNSLPPEDDFKYTGVGETGPAFLIAAFAQALPFGFPHGGRPMELLYFLSTACSALFIGCKRSPLEPLYSAPLTKLQAIVAPLASSVFLFGAYLLIKYTQIDVSIFFNFATTFLGLSCVAGTVQPLYQSLLPKKLPGLSIPIKLRKALGADKIGPDMILSALTAVGVAGAYIAHLEPNFLFGNVIAYCIGVRVLSIIRPDSFVVACGLLVGLLLYDVFWVFGADVMVTVATQVNSPGKFLVPRDLSQFVNTGSTPYPYSILGLGDCVIPGIFATLALFLDAVLVYGRKEVPIKGPIKSGPYFTSVS